MGISKTRQIGGDYQKAEPIPAEIELRSFEVFTQKHRGAPHVHAGSLQAEDLGKALKLAREHYGQDEACVHIWVVGRDHIGSTGSDAHPINKSIQHNYRYARDYRSVHRLWKKFRDDTDLAEYEREDLKEAY